MIIDFN